MSGTDDGILPKDFVGSTSDEIPKSSSSTDKKKQNGGSNSTESSGEVELPMDRGQSAADAGRMSAWDGSGVETEEVNCIRRWFCCTNDDDEDTGCGGCDCDCDD